MYETPRHFLTALGGYRSVALRLQMSATTLHGYMMAGQIPAKWYVACLALAAERSMEPPPRSFFAFEVLPCQPHPSEDAA